ncbi:cytochrome p450 [Echria macrotheca]|uniref:Cytochrome p450 n=1 Tax=Echria macrotheca TaxID=438768 RepID=A0AAJ0BMY9_9PEZI|nr:cytochrome p450 [Echria macrotheca]
MATFLVLASLVATAITTRYFLSWYRLRHVPGPFLESLTSLIQLKRCLEGECHVYYNEIAEKYGPLVRIGPNEVMFSDPETLRRCSAVRSPYTRGEYYEAACVSPGKHHSFSIIDDAAHTALKKKVSPGYSGLDNGGFEPAVDDMVKALVDLIERKYISTDTEANPIEFAHRAQFFTLDTISDVAHSKPFGHLEKDEDVFQYIHYTSLTIPVFTSILVIPGLYKWIQRWPLNKLAPTSMDKYGIGMMMGFAEKLVDERMRPGAKQHRDIVQSFINHGLTRDEIIQETCIQILGGSDTTATAMRMTLLYLINTPPALRKLLAEIDEGIASGKISSPISNAEALALPYLQAVIREGLRVFPPAVGVVYKAVPKGGDTIHGYFLPEGTQVGQNLWGMQHSRKIFGADADSFRPERWLTADKDQLNNMIGTQELVFGYGKYLCLGKQMALMELNKIFVELLRRYEFSVVNPLKPMAIRNAALWVTDDFWLKITRRG